MDQELSQKSVTEDQVNAAFTRLGMMPPRYYDLRDLMTTMSSRMDRMRADEFLVGFEQLISFANRNWGLPIVWQEQQLCAAALSLLDEPQLKQVIPLIKIRYRDSDAIQNGFSAFKWFDNIFKNPLDYIQNYPEISTDVRFLVELHVARLAQKTFQTLEANEKAFCLAAQFDLATKPVLIYRGLIYNGLGGFVTFANSKFEEIKAFGDDLKPQMAMADTTNVVAFLRPKA